MADTKFTNPLIQANDAYETADNLRAMLHFMANVALSDAMNDKEGKRSYGLIMDMCAEVAVFLKEQSDPHRKA